MNAAQIESLSAWLGAEVTAMSLMSGGAIQQNWRLDVRLEGVVRHWVLRTDAAATLSVSRSRAEEFALLRAAFAEGVTVPEPLRLCEDLGVIGRPFFVMRRVEGVTDRHRIVRSETLGGGRDRLVAALGTELAMIHAIGPPAAGLGFLGTPVVPATARFLAAMRAALDDGRGPRPILEWGLRHLERTAAADGATVLCHNDFRSGNFMVDEDGISGILDWEFAAWGDPHEDIGWLCAPCWRAGGPGEAGGIGSRAPFYAAYEARSGRVIDRARVAWWEVAACIRWAVIAQDQAQRHLSGAEPSLQLALTGHFIPEVELQIMRAIA